MVSHRAESVYATQSFRSLLGLGVDCSSSLLSHSLSCSDVAVVFLFSAVVFGDWTAIRPLILRLFLSGCARVGACCFLFFVFGGEIVLRITPRPWMWVGRGDSFLGCCDILFGFGSICAFWKATSTVVDARGRRQTIDRSVESPKSFEIRPRCPMRNSASVYLLEYPKMIATSNLPYCEGLFSFLYYRPLGRYGAVNSVLPSQSYLHSQK